MPPDFIVQSDRAVYEANGVFPAGVIAGITKMLKKYNNKDLSQRFFNKNDEIKKLVDGFFNFA
ncbi:hypothetical protein UCH007_10060 [Dehalococcoides sp. UCH007]|nr:hypothetical protein UCH007_10060 [Dehalococcoides sp. UCH007]